MVNEKGEEVGIIYGWYNTLTDMWYIGQTIHPERRFKRHIDYAINKKDNNRFHNALRKYGLDNFIYCVLEDNVLKENLNMRETDWIEYYDSFYSGYNMTTGGDTNVIILEETRKKISESLKGRILPIQTRKRMSESRKGRIGPNKGKPAPNRKKVLQYDLEGNYIQTYNSIFEAQKQNTKCGGPNIIKVCKGERNQAGGFIWKYA